MKRSVSLTLLMTLLATPMVMADAPTTRPFTLPRSESFELTSAQGHVYRISVAEPSPAPSPVPEAGYATFFVLDANAFFLTAVDAVRFQKNLVPTLVVGIGYPADVTVDLQRRYHDFTPVTPDEHIWTSGTEPRAKPEQTGGQDDFLDFIETVVKPEIEKRYKLDRTRQALLGHSLGGRLVLHAMFTRPESFSHYLAVSPSIWWNARSIVPEAEAFKASRTESSKPVSLLLTIGDLEQNAAPGTSAERRRFFEMAKMVDNAQEMSERLSGLESQGVTVKYVHYPDENHGSVVPAAISRSVRFAFQLPPAAKPVAAEK